MTNPMEDSTEDNGRTTSLLIGRQMSSDVNRANNFINSPSPRTSALSGLASDLVESNDKKARLLVLDEDIENTNKIRTVTGEINNTTDNGSGSPSGSISVPFMKKENSTRHEVISGILSQKKKGFLLGDVNKGLNKNFDNIVENERPKLEERLRINPKTLQKGDEFERSWYLPGDKARKYKLGSIYNC